jgi:glycosyltransferase involved in cell wall biosynthesis
MKIAVLTSIINRRSGARAPLETAKALKRQGNDVTVFALNVGLERQAWEELEKADIKIFLMPKNSLSGPLRLYRKLKGEHFDIISFHWASLLSFFATRASGIPIVRTYYGTQLNPLLDKVFPEKPNPLLKTANRLVNLIIGWKEKVFLLGSNKVLAISQFTQEELKNLYHIPSETIYLGASSKSFKKKASKRKKGQISILSVSRIVPYKGFHKLIEVFNELNKKFPNIKLTLIGSSPDRKYLSYLKKIAGKNILIKTNASDKELIKAYQQADIYATFDRYMFFGMPILEAATFAVPSISIARCAALETIKHGKTGYLAKDEAEFSRFLERLIKNEKIRKKLGQEAFQNSQNFSWKNLAQKYQRVFEKVKREGRRKVGWALAGIILLGIALRLAFIDKHAFWFDEAFSFFVAKKPLTLLLNTSLIGTNPPFYFLLLKLWSIISVKVVFLRSLSLIFGLFTLLIGYQVFKRLTNSRIALLTTSFLALSPLHVYYSTETRMYSLLVLETLFLSWLFLKFAETKNKASPSAETGGFLFPLLCFLFASSVRTKPDGIRELRNKFYLGLISLGGILALYTHYYSALFLLSLNLLFLVRIKKYRPLLKSWLISQLIIGLSFTPWLFWALQNLKTSCWCFPPQIGLPAALTSFIIGGMGVVTLKDFVFYGPKLSLAFLSASSLFAFILFLSGLKTNRSLNLFGFFFIPVLAASIAALFFPIFSPRALIIISPFYYLLIAIGILSIKGKLAQKLVTISLLSLIIITLVFQYTHPFFSGPPIKKAADFISKEYQEGEAILHTNPMTFYSFLYFHKESYSEFLALSPGISPREIFEIDGYQKSSSEIASDYQGVWLVNPLRWVTFETLEKVKSNLASFSFDTKKQYDNIEIYHYHRQ